MSATLIYAQPIQIDFENGTETSDFVDFDGGTATVIENPFVETGNSSATVAQIVRNGGQVWAGSKLVFDDNFDFTSFNSITMKVFTTAPIGTIIKLKLEGGGTMERDMPTTVSGAWEEITWDFTGAQNIFNVLAFMFDFGNVGDGSETSIFLFDDVQQIFGGLHIDLPVDFENTMVNYTMSDFGGNKSMISADPTDAENTVMKVVKTAEAATWAGTTIGTPAGFKTDIPLTLMNSKMTVRVWSPMAGTPIRLKVEDSDDPTHTCETEVETSVSGDWEMLEFDFTNQAPGTELLSVGLNMGWTFNMASIFFNFGTEGSIGGDSTYFFDDVRFGELVHTSEYEDVEGLIVYPNPAKDHWHFTTDNVEIESIAIYNLQGKLLVSMYPNKSSATINTRELPKGTFIAKVSTNSSRRTLHLINI